MNKILFKLIEGKGKFFLFEDSNCNGKPYCCEGDPCKALLAQDEAGEIVNPEALPIRHSYTHECIYYIWEPLPTRIKFLKDGDTFDLPEGMGCKEESDQSKCNYCKLDCLRNLKGIPCKAPKAIRLLPSEKPVQVQYCPTCGKPERQSEFCSNSFHKPVQKEESQEELWDLVYNNYVLWLSQEFRTNDLLRDFTIKRK